MGASVLDCKQLRALAEINHASGLLVLLADDQCQIGPTRQQMGVREHAAQRQCLGERLRYKEPAAGEIETSCPFARYRGKRVAQLRFGLLKRIILQRSDTRYRLDDRSVAGASA